MLQLKSLQICAGTGLQVALRQLKPAIFSPSSTFSPRNSTSQEQSEFVTQLILRSAKDYYYKYQLQLELERVRRSPSKAKKDFHEGPTCSAYSQVT